VNIDTGEFPRGIALLNFLHERLASMETWDTSSTFADLLRWLLEKTSVPFLEALSDIVAEGTVSESTDPHVRIVRLILQPCSCQKTG
jgi:hypothetical protein